MANKNISIVITDEVREKLDAYAKQEDRNISWVVRKAIEEFFERHLNEEEGK